MEPGKVLRLFLNIETGLPVDSLNKNVPYKLIMKIYWKNTSKPCLTLDMFCVVTDSISVTDIQIHPKLSVKMIQKCNKERVEGSPDPRSIPPVSTTASPLRESLPAAWSLVHRWGLAGDDTAVSAVFMSWGVGLWEDGRIWRENINLSQSSPCRGGGPSFLQRWPAHALTASFSFLSPSSCQVRRSS